MENELILGDIPASPELDALRAQYDLGDWLECYPAPGGSRRDGVCVVTTRGEFAVRPIPASTTPAGIRFQVAVMEHLRAGGFPAPALVATRTGGPAEGAASGFTVAEGLPGRPYDAAHPGHLAEAARGLAWYHDVIASFPDRLRTAGRPVLPVLEHLGPPALEAFTEVARPGLGFGDRERLTRATSYLWSQFIRVPEALAGILPALPQVVIHGSFGPSGLLFDDHGLSGVVDYHRAAYDRRVVDLAASIGALAAGPGAPGRAAHGLDLERCAVFMDAYRGELWSAGRELSGSEIDALPLVWREDRLVDVLSATRVLTDPLDCLLSGWVIDARSLLDIVDLLEAQAEALRWLEAEEHDLRAALSGSRVA